MVDRVKAGFAINKKLPFTGYNKVKRQKDNRKKSLRDHRFQNGQPQRVKSSIT